MTGGDDRAQRLRGRRTKGSRQADTETLRPEILLPARKRSAAKEAERAAKDAALATADTEREAKEAARAVADAQRTAEEAALERIAELEAELAKRG